MVLGQEGRDGALRSPSHPGYMNRSGLWGRRSARRLVWLPKTISGGSGDRSVFHGRTRVSWLRQMCVSACLSAGAAAYGPALVHSNRAWEMVCRKPVGIIGFPKSIRYHHVPPTAYSELSLWPLWSDRLTNHPTTSCGIRARLVSA